MIVLRANLVKASQIGRRSLKSCIPVFQRLAKFPEISTDIYMPGKKGSKRSFGEAIHTGDNDNQDDTPAHKRAKMEAQSKSNDKSNEESKISERDKESDLIWVDCEMTGLDLSKHYICEIAIVITDSNLNVIAEGPNMVIKQSNESMKKMDDWCKNEFKKSGLIDEINNSKISMKEAESKVLKFLADNNVPRKKIPLCGNSIHADKRFLQKDMPLFNDYLHYRIIDVSTIKELARRWFPKKFEDLPPKKKGHRALDDIKESIEELKWYRKNLFIE